HLADPFDDTLKLRAWYPKDRLSQSFQREGAGREALAEIVATQRNSVGVLNFQSDDQFRELGARGSALGVPLLDGENRILGVLLVARPNPSVFQGREMLEHLAVQVVNVIQTAEIRNRLAAGETASLLGDLAFAELHRIRSLGVQLRASARQLSEKTQGEDEV